MKKVLLSLLTVLMLSVPACASATVSPKAQTCSTVFTVGHVLPKGFKGNCTNGAVLKYSCHVWLYKHNWAQAGHKVRHGTGSMFGFLERC